MKASLERLWAVAALTLVEASRRKVFTILLLFAAALLICVAFFPAVSPEARLRLIEAWALRATALFTTIVALFLPGFSLPGDFETKRIYLVVTKPISKRTVFLGRYAGFLLLLLVFLAIVGAITVVFIRGVKLATGPGFPRLVAYPRRHASEMSDRGGERMGPDHEKVLVTFGPDREIVWRFDGLNAGALPPSVRFQVTLTVGSPEDSFRTSGNVRWIARDPASGAVHEQVVLLQQNEEFELAFPGAILGAGNTIEIAARCADPDGQIVGRADSVVLFEKEGSFELNFARGLLLAFLQSALVLSLTLMASTFLSAPVSILLGVFLYTLGSGHGFFLEGTRIIERSLEEAAKDPRRQHGRSPEGLPPGVLGASKTIAQAVLAIVPDFDRYDFGRWLLKDLGVSWRDLAHAAFPHAAVHLLVMAALGCAVMAFKDFG